MRKEAGLTAEGLAYESDLGSKGFLSDIENGLALPSLKTLKILADHLGVPLLDFVTFPEDDPRQALVDRTRKLTQAAITKLAHDLRKYEKA